MLTRRELTLLLFCATVFFVAFNFEKSVKHYAPSAVLNLSAASLVGQLDIFRNDGRRVKALSDDLEREIVGDWDDEQRRLYDLGPHGLSEDKQEKTWTHSTVPVSSILAHVPGYTILENVFLVNGTILVVSDPANASEYPKPESMISTGLASSHPPVLQDIQFVTTFQILQAFGNAVHRLPGTSVLCFDHPNLVDNYTLPALYRAYSVLEHVTSPLPPLDRTFFVNVKNEESFFIGFPRHFSRSALPFMNLFYAEDWDDYERATRPFFFDRVLIMDRVAALHGAKAFDFDASSVTSLSAPAEPGKENNRKRVSIEAIDKHLTFSPPFAFPASPEWFLPIRQSLLAALALQDSSAIKTHRAVTYVSTQKQRSRAHLREDDHARLVFELDKLTKAQGWNLHIVELNEEGMTVPLWKELVSATLNSNVMLGVYGDALSSSTLMKYSKSPSTIIEFFPDGKYTNENEFITRAVGMDYIAWRNTKKYPRGSLPPISPPSDADLKPLSIDVHAVVQTVRELLRRR